MADPGPCPHAHTQLIAEDEHEKYVECLDCGAIFEAGEIKNPLELPRVPLRRLSVPVFLRLIQLDEFCAGQDVWRKYSVPRRAERHKASETNCLFAGQLEGERRGFLRDKETMCEGEKGSF